MKNLMTFAVIAVLALIVGGIFGYIAMPEKVREVPVASVCPAIPSCNPTLNVPACPVPVVNVSKVQCDQVKIVHDCEQADSDVVHPISYQSTRDCDNLLREKYNSTMPFCFRHMNVTSVKAIESGCLLKYVNKC